MLDFEINGSGVAIVLFGRFPIMAIPYADIAEVRIVSSPVEYLSLNPFTSITFNTIIGGDRVLIRKRKGYFKSVFISPDDPQAFVDYANRWMVQTKPQE